MPVTDDRLPTPFGSRIDRSKPISFRFEGTAYRGYAGDTVASALMANGRFVLSRSFKYHRPRGCLSLASHDSNGLVRVGREPNVFAENRGIEEGMEVRGQNYAGSLDGDRRAIFDRCSRFLPVGFQYRTFRGPTKAAFLKLWEPMIRRRAGLGRISLDAPHCEYDKAFRFCDVLVVGAGAAGMSAALTAARAGADVLLVDEEAEPGGMLNYARGNKAASIRARLVREVSAANIALLTGAVCNGWYADNWLPVIQGTRLHKVRAGQVVVAAGVFEQPVVFRNNDLPGIMLSTAAQRAMHLYGVRPGRRAVVLTCSAQGYEAAADLANAGIKVAAIIDARPDSQNTPPQGVRALRGYGVAEADGGRRNWHLRRVMAARINGDRYVEAGEWIDCDLLCVSGGSMPVYQLPLQAGARLGYDDATARFHIRGVPEGMKIAGAANGAGDLDAVMADGARAGDDAAAALGVNVKDPSPDFHSVGIPNFDWPLRAHPRGKDFVDFDEDLQVHDIENAIAEGYSELELLKRFSTVGMGPSQGRHAALATSRIVARRTGRTVATVGVTTSRPPFTAENLGVLAGPRRTQRRHTPMHFRHLEIGAKMQPAGTWWRPSFYGRGAGTPHETIEAEVAAVRLDAGMLDVSTLGCLEVRGPDAAELLNRLYTLRYDTQAVGRIRYLLLVNEMGSIIDDGVAYRMAKDHFYITSTTGAVGAVHQLMLFMNAQWGLSADVLNATAVFAGINVTGPNARALMSELSDDTDFSAEAFPYMHGRTGTVCGVPARFMRIGFTGELSYEAHVPWSCGEALWDRLLAAGARPYGLEASRILRLEKGHIIIGQDTDSMTTPEQVGLDWAVSEKKSCFLGKRSIDQRSRLGMDRRLVGFETVARKNKIAESCLVMNGNMPTGFVTSVCWSPTLKRCIGLAYAGPEVREGDTISIRTRSGTIETVPVVPHRFFDPRNSRQKV